MSKQIRTLQANWLWSGDDFALKGFNIAITPLGGNPNTDSIITGQADKIQRTYTFYNLTVETGLKYEVWVQAYYDGYDSSWVNQATVTVPDDGSATIETIQGAQSKADQAESNANTYTNETVKLKDKMRVKPADALLWHFNETITSTDGTVAEII